MTALTAKSQDNFDGIDEHDMWSRENTGPSDVQRVDSAES